MERGGGGVISSFKWFLPVFATRRVDAQWDFVGLQAEEEVQYIYVSTLEITDGEGESGLTRSQIHTTARKPGPL